MRSEDFWRVNVGALIAFGLLMIVFLLVYIAFFKDDKTSRSKSKK